MYLCRPVYTCVYLCISWYIWVNQSVSQYIWVYLCIPVYTCVYPSISECVRVSRSISEYTGVYRCKPAYIGIYRSVSECLSVYLSISVYTCIPAQTASVTGQHTTMTAILFYVYPKQLNSSQYGYSYLLGLLAMIKCSICSYQCDIWYVSNWRLACHIYFSKGRCLLELAQKPLHVALALHIAKCSIPSGVTSAVREHRCEHEIRHINCFDNRLTRQLFVTMCLLVYPCRFQKMKHPCGRGNDTTSDA